MLPLWSSKRLPEVAHLPLTVQLGSTQQQLVWPRSSFPRLQEPLLPRELCCLFSIKGGYSQGLTVFIIGPPMVDQVESGPHNYMLPVMVACQVWWVTRHIHPIVHSASKMLKAIHITQVHLWVSSPKGITLLLLATVLLHAVEQCCLEDFISNNTLSIHIICSHSFVHVKQFVKHVQ